MHAAGKFFVKTCLKANRDNFFPNMWYFQYVKFLSNRRGKFKLLALQGTPPPFLVSSLSGPSWSPHEENPEGGWSAYCSDFLSKQNIYSM